MPLQALPAAALRAISLLMIPFNLPPAALVTGAGKRLGRAMALALAEAGFDVAIHYAASAEAAEATAADIRALGRRAITLKAELGQEAEVAQLIPHAPRRLARWVCW